MHVPSRVLTSRVIVLIVILALIAAGIAFAARVPEIARGFCGQAGITLLPDTLQHGICDSSPQTKFPSDASAQGASSFNTPSPRGISCPLTAKPGTPITISWSCGSSSLFAVAGFSLADKSATSAIVTPTASSSVYGIQCANGYQDVCSIDTANPQVRIWADPARVRLGARANIFWAAEDVQSCHVTGPSFDETGVSGGSATVPITTATTFTATCITNASTTVSASVRVDFAQ